MWSVCNKLSLCSFDTKCSHTHVEKTLEKIARKNKCSNLRIKKPKQLMPSTLSSFDTADDYQKNMNRTRIICQKSPMLLLERSNIANREPINDKIYHKYLLNPLFHWRKAANFEAQIVVGQLPIACRRSYAFAHHALITLLNTILARFADSTTQYGLNIVLWKCTAAGLTAANVVHVNVLNCFSWWPSSTWWLKLFNDALFENRDIFNWNSCKSFSFQRLHQWCHPACNTSKRWLSLVEIVRNYHE